MGMTVTFQMAIGPLSAADAAGDLRAGPQAIAVGLAMRSSNLVAAEERMRNAGDASERVSIIVVLSEAKNLHV